MYSYSTMKSKWLVSSLAAFYLCACDSVIIHSEDFIPFSIHQYLKDKENKKRIDGILSGKVVPSNMDDLQITFTGTMDERKEGTHIIKNSNKYNHKFKIEPLNLKNKQTYKIIDVFSFENGQTFRKEGEINRLNKPKIPRIPVEEYCSNKYTEADYWYFKYINYKYYKYCSRAGQRESMNRNQIGWAGELCNHKYKKTGANSATLTSYIDRDTDYYISEQYILTFSDGRRGTYTYISMEKNTLIAKGHGTFIIEKEELPYKIIKKY